MYHFHAVYSIHFEIPLQWDQTKMDFTVIQKSHKMTKVLNQAAFKAL